VSDTRDQGQAPGSFDEHERLAGLVHAFIAMMRAGNIDRMDLRYRDLQLSLRAHGAAATMQTTTPAASVPAVTMATGDGPPPVMDGHHVVTAPMIGTFYVASAPNESPFVQPGDHVDEGQTVGIIEAMKIMNEIAADRSGTVVEIVARNAQPVEYGSPLITILPDAA
jgi:acetyl-CoA carboxylase biotin carboxyl carrier protein